MPIPKTKDKESILAALTGNVPEEMLDTPTTEVVAKSHKPPVAEMDAESEEDYKFSRAHVKKLVETSDDALATMMNLAQDSEHPRAFEVLATLLKTSSDINKQLQDLHKERKKILADPQDSPQGGGNTTNNAIFVGTTSDLQKYLSGRGSMTETTIDAQS